MGKWLPLECSNKIIIYSKKRSFSFLPKRLIEIPVIQTFSSIINVAVLECMQSSAVRKALDAAQLNEKCPGASGLEQYEYLSQLLESSLNRSAALSEFMSIVERIVNCLRPLKVSSISINKFSQCKLTCVQQIIQ